MPSLRGLGSCFYELTPDLRPGLLYAAPFDSAQGRLYGAGVGRFVPRLSRAGRFWRLVLDVVPGASGPMDLGRRTAGGGCPHMVCGAALSLSLIVP